MGFENQIIYPTTTYRYNQRSQYAIANPMVHRATKIYTNCNNNYNSNGPKRYHYIRNNYEDLDSDDATSDYGNREDKCTTCLEDEHNGYGCNL